MTDKYDFIVIGGGILGVSTAWQLQKRFPGRRIALLEKEAELASHQTGHNSGVIHAGVYYKPGSLKAQFCYQGNSSTIGFCDEYGVPYDQCGKLLVATDSSEMERMKVLQGRASKNGLETHLIDSTRLSEMEPNIEGVGATLVPSTAIVSFPEVAKVMASLFREQGGQILLGSQVVALDEHRSEVAVTTEQKELNAKFLVSCGGLMSDRLVRMLGLTPGFQIIPFRGEYYQLTALNNNIIKHLIYPIPNPELPFLGVHLTRMIDGSVTVGPNAVLSFKREGYGQFDFSLRDSAESLAFPGLFRLMKRHLGTTMDEFIDSFSKRHYLSRVQKYCPGLTLDDLQPYPSGVRAQAVSRDGSMIDDFLFVNSNRTVNVCNAPSPAATSSIPIGNHIVEQVLAQVGSVGI